MIGSKLSRRTAKDISLFLQLVEVVCEVGQTLLQALPLPGFRDNDPWARRGVGRVTRKDLPVVEDALREGLTSGIGTQVSSEA